MARHVSNFTLGLFVVIGLVTGVTAIVWLGASRYFKTGHTYVTFLDESVQGLDVDSVVKYRGVKVGRVEKIEIAPDHRLIEVVMMIYKKDVIEPNTIAEKGVAGLSGQSFINLLPGTPAEIARSPKIEFKVKYPVIPSKPAELEQILSEADKTMGKLKQFDFRGVSDQLKATAKSMEDFLTDPRMKHIMDNVETVTAHLDSVTRQIDRIVSEGDVKDVITDMKKTLSEARDVIGNIRSEVKSMNLKGTTANANRLMEDIDRRTGRITGDVQSTIENLDETIGSLDKLVERLRTNPSDIICSKPLPARTDEQK